MKNKLVMILPYFGKLPKYFNFFLKSLTGKNFDVLFISNLSVERYPENFKVVRMTLAEIARLAREKMATDVNLNSPRRLCDFKPMYGHIFEDYIKDYGYWAFGDCDLVYGNKMNEAIDRIFRGDYDVFSFRKCWTSGAFCVFKNNERISKLYQKASNWKTIVSASVTRILNFDEVGHPNFFEELEAGRMVMADVQRYGDCFSAVVWRELDIRLSHEDLACESDLCSEFIQMTSNGDLLLSAREPIVFFHYIHVKGKWFKQLNVPFDQIGAYRIARSGFYLMPMSLLEFELRKWMRYAVSFCAAAYNKIRRMVRA